jgi:zinc and cadmium transporter
VLAFFLVEAMLHWHHHGEDVDQHAAGHVSSLAWMNLLGDGIHNFLDGMLIAGTWIASPEAGLATTIAVALHEIPQEFGDFGVLLHAGLSPRLALALNFLSASAAFLGAGLVLVAEGALHLEGTLVPVAAGGFLYVACADLVPELRKRARGAALLAALLALAAGILLVAAIPGPAHGEAHGHDDHPPAAPDR